MSYITATQLLGAHAIATKATAHFQHTGESAHPDTNTTFFPAPNHRLRNPVKSRLAKKAAAAIATAYRCKFSGPRFPAPVTRAVKGPEETPKRTDCGCEHCLAFYAGHGLQLGVVAVGDSAAAVKTPVLNAAAAEFTPAISLNAAAPEFTPAVTLNAAVAEFVLAVALVGIPADAAAALVTDAPVINVRFDIKSLWDNSTYVEVPSHSTALLAPIVPTAPVETQAINIKSLWDDSTYIESLSHPTALFAPIVAGAYSWPCGPFTETSTPTPVAPCPVRPLASIQQFESLTADPNATADRNVTADRRSSTSSNVSASESLFSDNAADETSSATTTSATDTFRQLSEHDIALTALEYGIDLEDFEAQGRELVGWERLIEEEL